MEKELKDFKELKTQVELLKLLLKATIKRVEKNEMDIDIIEDEVMIDEFEPFSGFNNRVFE